MIVSRKNDIRWKNLEGKLSRLSGTSFSKAYYVVNDHFHRLYGRSYGIDWDLNGKSFKEFKDVWYDSF